MKVSSFQPYGKRVLIKLDDAKQMTDGGIIIPDSAQRPSRTAIVRAIGDECTKVKKGTKVLIPQAGGIEIDVNDEKLFLIHENDIDGEIE